MGAIRKRAIRYEVSSGKVTEVFITPINLNLLRSGNKAWLKVDGEWLVLNPNSSLRHQNVVGQEDRQKRSKLTWKK